MTPREKVEAAVKTHLEHDNIVKHRRDCSDAIRLAGESATKLIEATNALDITEHAAYLVEYEKQKEALRTNG